jgi:hypothetical protein
MLTQEVDATVHAQDWPGQVDQGAKLSEQKWQMEQASGRLSEEQIQRVAHDPASKQAETQQVALCLSSKRAADPAAKPVRQTKERIKAEAEQAVDGANKWQTQQVPCSAASKQQSKQQSQQRAEEQSCSKTSSRWRSSSTTFPQPMP